MSAISKGRDFQNAKETRGIYPVFLNIQKPFDTRNIKERNIFEKEFDVADMTQQTLENLFKQIGLKPDKVVPEKNSPRLNPKVAAQGKIQDNNSKKQPLNLKVNDSYQDDSAI